MKCYHRDPPLLSPCDLFDRIEMLKFCQATRACVPLFASALVVFAGDASTRAAIQDSGVAPDTVIVRMIGDQQGYRVEPASVRVPSGGAVRFVVVRGGPHNVAFEDTLAPTVAARLQANMQKTLGPLAGVMIMIPGESYTVSLAGVPAGVYGFHCVPHQLVGERGEVIVTE